MRTQRQDVRKSVSPQNTVGGEGAALRSVSCCGYHMGDFIPAAQVRCPSCGKWHRAADYPPAS